MVVRVAELAIMVIALCRDGDLSSLAFFIEWKGLRDVGIVIWRIINGVVVGLCARDDGANVAEMYFSLKRDFCVEGDICAGDNGADVAEAYPSQWWDLGVVLDICAGDDGADAVETSFSFWCDFRAVIDTCAGDDRVEVAEVHPSLWDFRVVVGVGVGNVGPTVAEVYLSGSTSLLIGHVGFDADFGFGIRFGDVGSEIIVEFGSEGGGVAQVAIVCKES